MGGILGAKNDQELLFMIDVEISRRCGTGDGKTLDHVEGICRCPELNDLKQKVYEGMKLKEELKASHKKFKRFIFWSRLFGTIITVVGWVLWMILPFLNNHPVARLFIDFMVGWTCTHYLIDEWMTKPRHEKEREERLGLL